jgi:dUTP pyrophosphatase
MKLNVKIIDSNAKLPTYGSDYAAGLDLYANSNCTIIKPGSRECVSTGIALEWSNNNESDENPKDFYLRIAPRSGLSFKNGIDVMAGVIDYDYRGEIKVILLNTSDTDFVISQGDKIAQAILTRITRFDEIVLTNVLNGTSRGEGGFGSTGTK